MSFPGEMQRFRKMSFFSLCGQNDQIQRVSQQGKSISTKEQQEGESESVNQAFPRGESGEGGEKSPENKLMNL